MQSGGIARFRKLVKSRLGEFIGRRSLEDSSTLGRLGLESLFDIRVLQLIHSWIDFDLEGHGEVFCRVLYFPL